MRLINQFVQGCLGILGAVIGFPLGALIAFYSIALTGTALWGGEFNHLAWVFLTFGVPCGAVLGVYWNAKLAMGRPRLFLVTVLPIALLALIYEVQQYHLRRATPPRTFMVKIIPYTAGMNNWKPATGRKFVGTITTDGGQHQIKGTVPATFTYTAVRMEYDVALTDGPDNEVYMIEVTADGQRAGAMLSDFKVSGEAWTSGAGRWKRADGSSGAKWNKDRREGSKD